MPLCFSLSVENEIMKKLIFCKKNLSIQQNISSLYNRLAVKFQYEHNQRQPHQRIWRHMLYPRTFFFFLHGTVISVQVEIVRFRFAGTNRTFTYYGPFFLPYSKFSRPFIHAALRADDMDTESPSLMVSCDTLASWRSRFFRFLPASGTTP